jgi:hypothetical protein
MKKINILKLIWNSHSISNKKSRSENISVFNSYFFFRSLSWARVISPLLRRISSSLVSGFGTVFNFFHTSSGSCSANGFLKFGGSPNELFMNFNSESLQITIASYLDLLTQTNTYNLIKGIYSTISSTLVGLTTSSVIIPSK